jgi:hypothetical protein
MIGGYVFGILAKLVKSKRQMTRRMAHRSCK